MPKFSGLLTLLIHLNISSAGQGKTISGLIKEGNERSSVPYVNVTLKKVKDSSFCYRNYNREKIIDLGDIPFFNSDLSKRNRLWQFLEDEVKYTARASASFQHKFKQPGHLLSAGYNYTRSA